MARYRDGVAGSQRGATVIDFHIFTIVVVQLKERRDAR